MNDCSVSSPDSPENLASQEAIEATESDQASDAPNHTLEDYERLCRELQSTMEAQELLKEEFARKEIELYNLERQYLEETPYGNIFKGFDGFLGSARDMRGAGRKRERFEESDRVFSKDARRNLRLVGLDETLIDQQESGSLQAMASTRQPESHRSIDLASTASFSVEPVTANHQPEGAQSISSLRSASPYQEPNSTLFPTTPSISGRRSTQQESFEAGQASQSISQPSVAKSISQRLPATQDNGQSKCLRCITREKAISNTCDKQRPCNHCQALGLEEATQCQNDKWPRSWLKNHKMTWKKWRKSPFKSGHSYED